MESWRKAWRESVAPQLSGPGLRRLADGLEYDDPCILQGQTVDPPHMYGFRHADAEACCPIGYACWQGDGRKTVEDVQSAFQRVCWAGENTIPPNDTSAIHFLRFVDDSPREVMRRELLAEVRLELARRDGETIETLDAC
jgi:hypothetical protein